MIDEIPVPSPPLSIEESAAVARLSAQELEFIDAAVLSCVQAQWRKVAMVVGMSVEKLSERYPQFSDVFYAERVQALADAGRLQSQGDLSYVRFSEVRRINET